MEAITGLRGVASLIVVGYHAVLFYWLWQFEGGLEADAFEHPLSAYALGAGFLGVDLFFVLSGFLLARPLLRMARGMDRLQYRDFAAKRLLRIAPPYYAALLLAYALVGWARHPLFTFTTEGVVAHVLYVHTFFDEHAFGMLAVSWTLALELQFYLLLPLMIIPFRRYGPVVAVPCAMIALAYLAWAHDPDFFRNRLQTFQLPAFLGHFGFGIAAAQLVQRDLRLRVQPDVAVAALFATLIVVPAWVTGYARQFEPVDAPLFTYFVRLLAGMFFACAMVLMMQPRSLLGRALTWRPMIWVGEASYSLYLVHYTIAGAFLIGRPDWAFVDLPTFTFLLTVISLAAAAVFYILVERPSLQFKEAVARRLGGVPRPRGLDPAP